MIALPVFKSGDRWQRVGYGGQGGREDKRNALFGNASHTHSCLLPDDRLILLAARPIRRAQKEMKAKLNEQSRALRSTS